MIPHITIIQSAYTDDRLSRQRLEISRHTVVPSLAFQTRKPVVHIAVNPDDPHLQERLDLFNTSGCEVIPLMRPSWKLYKEDWELPEGRKIVSRIDDDDVWAKDYCERTVAAAPAEGEHYLSWPRGYVFWRQNIYLLDHPGIQFVTLVTDKMCDPHQEQHWQYPKTWNTIRVSRSPGWVWVRHGDAATSTLPRYRQPSKHLRGIDSTRIPINLRAIIRAIEPSGLASGNYAEKKDMDTTRWVLQENKRNAPRQ